MPHLVETVGMKCSLVSGSKVVRDIYEDRISNIDDRGRGGQELLMTIIYFDGWEVRRLDRWVFGLVSRLDSS